MSVMPHDEELQRKAAAYHESGHVVVGYWFGWWLNSEGVEIDGLWYTGCRKLPPDNTVEADVVNSLAGWLSEHKWHGKGRAHVEDEEAIDVLEAVRIDDSEELAEVGDLADVARKLHEQDPKITDENFLKAVTAYRDQTLAILAEPAVWRSIEKVAAALLAFGRLSDEDAQEAIGDELIFGRGCSRLIKLKEFLDQQSGAAPPGLVTDDSFWHRSRLASGMR